MSKTLKILIISSLILNVFLIGIIIGGMSDHLFRKDFPGGKPPVFGLKLSPDKEKLFLDTMEKAFRENDRIRIQMDEARERVLSILSAPEFDEAAYKAETSKLEELRGVMMQRFADATRELAKQFGQEERKALAEHLRHPPLPPHWAGPPPRSEPPSSRIP